MVLGCRCGVRNCLMFYAAGVELELVQTFHWGYAFKTGTAIHSVIRELGLFRSEALFLAVCSCGLHHLRSLRLGYERRMATRDTLEHQSLTPCVGYLIILISIRRDLAAQFIQRRCPRKGRRYRSTL